MCKTNSRQKSYTINVTPSVLRDPIRKEFFVFFRVYFLCFTCGRCLYHVYFYEIQFFMCEIETNVKHM